MIRKCELKNQATRLLKLSDLFSQRLFGNRFIDCLQGKFRILAVVDGNLCLYTEDVTKVTNKWDPLKLLTSTDDTEPLCAFDETGRPISRGYYVPRRALGTWIDRKASTGTQDVTFQELRKISVLLIYEKQNFFGEVADLSRLNKIRKFLDKCQKYPFQFSVHEKELMKKTKNVGESLGSNPVFSSLFPDLAFKSRI